MKTPSMLTALSATCILLVAVGAPAFAKPSYMKYDGVKGEAKAGKPGAHGARPNVAVGDVNGDGRANGKHLKNAKLTPRKQGTEASAQKSVKAPPPRPQEGLLLPAVQKAR